MTLPENLRQVDQRLIQLLGERISILATSQIPLTEEQLSSYRSLLLQAGVPESTWNTLISSMASLTTTPSPLHSLELRNITVVGGRGIMGRFFTQQLAPTGHRINVLEYDDWNQAEFLLGTADLVLICVPLNQTHAVIRKVAHYLPPTATLADIASTKTTIVQSMLENHPGPVLGLHPMFGPGLTSFLNQKVVACPGRNPTAFQWFLDLIEAQGAKLITCTPEEHDLMMVLVQAIRHFSTFSLGVFLAQESIPIDRSLDFASPIYRTQINLITRLFAQDATLSIDIMLASEERCEAIQRLAKTCTHLANLLTQNDRSALMAEFEAARTLFQKDAPRALSESNHLINHLSTFLAPSEVETMQLSSALALQ